MRLPAVLDLGAAAPLHAAFATARGAALEVDASGVERLGGLCLQVILAAQAAWAADGKAFAIINPSSGFMNAAGVMGAGETLQMGSAA